MADPNSRSGTSYLTPAILEYINKLHAPHDAGLAAAFEAPEKHGMPSIMVGPTEGKLLRLLLRMIGAKKVVEVGTLAGYSAINMARALPEDGHLWTVEYSPENARVAEESIARAGLSDRITVVVGAGVELLPTLEEHGPFDAVFIDADKGNYDNYGRWAAKNTRPGGLILGDNALYFGKLLDDSPEAAAMRRFHEEAAAAYDTVCITMPDGLLLGVKK